jgi:hypothetical protein
MSLLSVNADAKTVKGVKKGYLTGILYLSPATESGITNTCTHSTPGCRAACLYTAGRAAYFPRINEARRKRTEWMVNDRDSFLAQLEKDIAALVRKAKREGYRPCVRLNGTSDLPWLAHRMAAVFPKVQFYDYTKHPRCWERARKNYHLTFSLSEENDADAYECLQNGTNVAVVFNIKRGHPLPKTFWGYRVVDGDQTDLRFRNRATSNSASNPSNAGLTKLRGVVIGLRAKGRAKNDCTGFVQQGGLVQLMQAVSKSLKEATA